LPSSKSPGMKNQNSLFKDLFGELYILAWTTTLPGHCHRIPALHGKDIDYILVKTYNPYTFKKADCHPCKRTAEPVFSWKECWTGTWEIMKKPEEHSFWLPDRSTRARLLKGSFWGSCFLIHNPKTEIRSGWCLVILSLRKMVPESFILPPALAPTTSGLANNMAWVPSPGLTSKVKFNCSDGRICRQIRKDWIRWSFRSCKRHSVDIDLIVKLKKENKAFRTEKYEHSYPHCWRTDKPILYYPLDSWFIPDYCIQGSDDQPEQDNQLETGIYRYPGVSGTGSKTWSTGTFPVPVSGALPCRSGERKTGRRRSCISSVVQLKERDREIG